MPSPGGSAMTGGTAAERARQVARVLPCMRGTHACWKLIGAVHCAACNARDAIDSLADRLDEAEAALARLRAERDEAVELLRRAPHYLPTDPARPIQRFLARLDAEASDV